MDDEGVFVPNDQSTKDGFFKSAIDDLLSIKVLNYNQRK